jgi:hypothetical protein
MRRTRRARFARSHLRLRRSTCSFGVFAHPVTPGTTQTGLVEVLQEARGLLARPDNDFAWSSWEGAEDALRELDKLITRIQAGDMPKRLDLEVLFAPTGPVQEVSLSSGWGQEFLKLAEKFDSAIEKV